MKRIVMDKLIKKISIAKNTVYQHFQNKDVLSFDVVVNFFEMKREAFEAFKATASECITRIFSLQNAFKSAFP